MASLRVLAGVAALLISFTAAAAAPARIIIVRHGEKQAPLTLCSVGKERAQALAAQYLSPSSPMSLLKGETPAAIMAITLHTLETARPIAKTWGMKIATNPLMLTPIRNTPYFNGLINVQNRKVVDDLLTNPRWHGTTVLMVWEHFHIASAALEKEFAGQQVTLRQLMHLDRIKGAKVPDTWPDSNYNFFWILTYRNPTDTVPASFKVIRQYFAEPYANLPSNDWGAPEPLPPGSGCT